MITILTTTNITMAVMWLCMWYKMNKRIKELESKVCVYGRSDCLGYDCNVGKAGINGVIDGLVIRLGKNPTEI
jgi:hypothetical protein